MPLSCVPAAAFARFDGPLPAPYATSAARPVGEDEARAQDFAPSRYIPAKRAMLGFTLGLAASLAARKPVRAAFHKLSSLFPRPVAPYNKSLTLLLFQNPLSSLSMQALEEPRLAGALATYALATAAGYLATAGVQGYQEAWVRRQETEIRTRLLQRLQGTFLASLRDKQAFDAGLLNEAKTQVRSVLQRHGVPLPEVLVLPPPLLAESPDTQRRFFYEPTHRQFPMPAARFGLDGERSRDPNELLRPLDLAFAGAGVLSGLILHGFLNAVERFRADLKQYEAQAASGMKTIEKTISHTDSAALMILADRLQSKWLVLGYGALVGMAAVGKLMVDGLREIRVTQANAATEYRYQRANWLQLDPGYHRIVESETLARDVRRLESDLAYLARDPALLKQRVETILANVGRNSAPPYFPMTPMVGIVPARN